MKTPFDAYSNRTYRQDIQGVRAIGAVLIMIYHIWLNRVSGGVDVFFVVSGFVMTNTLLAQAATQGRIQPFIFWGKIIKRIAPSAYTVLMATLLLGYFFIPETRWVNHVDEIIVSAFHLENLLLMRTSVDYLANGEAPSAVQQFWALSIQVQFYFLLPLVLLAGVKLAGTGRSLLPLAVLCATVAVLSVTYSIAQTAQAPKATYFDPAARIWEFFVGVLIAIAAPHLRLGGSIRNALGMLGLSILLLCGMMIPKSANFPGYAALLPVLAASCLILSGLGVQAAPISRLLSNRYLAFIGGISFTIYLWHWPLLVFYREHIGAESVGFVAGLSVMACSVLLAFATHRLVERPLRELGSVGPDVRFAYLTGLFFLIPTVAASGSVRLHLNSILQKQIDSLGPFLSEPEIRPQSDASELPYAELIAAKVETPAPYEDACHQRTDVAEVAVCAYGDTTASTTIALVGGSHATQWLPALDTIGRQLNLKVLNITKSHCPFGAPKDAHPSCVEWNRRVISYLATNKPAVVVTNSTRTSKSGLEEYIPAAYVQQWQALARLGIDVIGIRDNPQFEFDVADCVARNRSNPLVCSKPKAVALQHQDPASTLASHLPNLKPIDMSEYFCSNDVCTTVFNNILMYRDREHLSVSYANYLTLQLHQKLAAASPQLFSTDRDLLRALECTSQ